MLTLAAANIRLIGAFHYIDVRIGGLRRAPGYEPVAATSKGPRWSWWPPDPTDPASGPVDREKLAIPAKERPSVVSAQQPVFGCPLETVDSFKFVVAQPITSDLPPWTGSG
jgi:hypothetical protein